MIRVLHGATGAWRCGDGAGGFTGVLTCDPLFMPGMPAREFEKSVSVKKQAQYLEISGSLGQPFGAIWDRVAEDISV